MSIVIFGDLFTFPEGSAATNRVYTYAKGFQENGVRVNVVCFFNEFIENRNGSIDGINYYHPFKQKKRNKYLIVRAWQELVKYFNTFRLIRRLNKEEKIIAINSWTNVITVQLLAWLIAKACRTKLVTECSEHPLRYYQHGFLRRKGGRVKFFIESRFCDGILCISKYIVDFHLANGIKKEKLLLVPSTVDAKRFVRKEESPEQYRYIGYFGGLTMKRDSIDLLIKAFAIVHKNHPELYLVLGGFCSDTERTELKNLITDLKIDTRVTLLPFLSRQEIIRYITNADILIMVRSNDIESQASYPSKLSEFLATGKPVVTVSVGEIPDYLTDNKTAFLVEPDNFEELAKKINLALSDYPFAIEVGKNGKQLAETTFSYNYQAKRILEFVTKSAVVVHE